MQTWMIFVGLEVVIVTITAIITICWMRSGNGEDAYDIRLLELSEMQAKSNANKN